VIQCRNSMQYGLIFARKRNVQCFHSGPDSRYMDGMIAPEGGGDK
jgi:hypothetical protein